MVRRRRGRRRPRLRHLVFAPRGLPSVRGRRRARRRGRWRARRRGRRHGHRWACHAADSGVHYRRCAGTGVACGCVRTNGIGLHSLDRGASQHFGGSAAVATGDQVQQGCGHGPHGIWTRHGSSLYADRNDVISACAIGSVIGDPRDESSLGRSSANPLRVRVENAQVARFARTWCDVIGTG